MYRIELKKRNKKIDATAKGSYKYITRSELSNKDMVKSTDIEYTFSKVPKLFEKKISNFWNEIDKFERKNGRVNSELLISIPREFEKEERVKLIDNLIKDILDNNTPYSYAIHNPIASDGLNNPHCHLMIYEKTFDRSFFKENFINEIDNDYFKGTFKKDKNYIKKNLKYEKKSFIYNSREKFEEQLLILSKSHTKEEILKSIGEEDTTDKNISKNYEQFIKTEQILLGEKRGEYMKEFKEILSNDKGNLEKLKKLLNNLDENNLKQFIVLFSKENQFFSDIKTMNNEDLKKNGYDDEYVKKTLTEITDLNALHSNETLINNNSDLLKINKEIRKNLDVEDLTNRYIYDQLLTQVFKNNDENEILLNLDINKYTDINLFFKKMKEEFKIDIKNYIDEKKINLASNEDETKEKNIKILNKEKHEIDCIKLEKKFDEKEKEFFENSILKNELRPFYYEFLVGTYNERQDEIKTTGYSDFYKNLEKNISNEFIELTRSFVYTDLFYQIETNYFSKKDDLDKTKKDDVFSKKLEKDNEKFLENYDYDFLNNISKRKKLHKRTFVPDLKERITDNVISILDNTETEYKNLGDKSIYKTSQRIEYVNKLKTILEANIKYLNQDNDFLKSNIYNQALKDRNKILRINLKDKNNEDIQSIPFKVNDKDYKTFIAEILENDRKNLSKNINGIFSELGSITDKENYSDVIIKNNLRPNLPLLKVKKYMIEDVDFGNMKELKLENKVELLELGNNIENYFQYKSKKNVLKSPSILEKAYNKATEIKKDIDINKDINHLIYLSLDKTNDDRLILSNVKLEKAKKYNLVNLKIVEEYIGKNIKKNTLKVSKNISNKIYDKNFIHKELIKEYDTKKKINDKVKEKEAFSYIGYSDDIEKINHTLKEIEYRDKKRNKLKTKNFSNIKNILDYNSVGFKNNSDTLNTIGTFFNWNTVQGYKISNELNTMNSDIELDDFNNIIDDKKYKQENNNIKNYMFPYSSDNKNKVSITDEMQKSIENIRDEIFFYRKKEILSFQMQMSTENLSMAKEKENQTLSEIDNLSKKTLGYMKKAIESINPNTDNEVFEIEDNVKRFERSNSNQLENRSKIEENYLSNISSEKLSKYVKDKKMIVISLEWKQTQNTEEKLKEMNKALSFTGKDLLKYNEDIAFETPQMSTENLYFKVYVKEENKENRRIVNLSSYNKSISADYEKIDVLTEEKIIKKYFSDIGYSIPKSKKEWNNEEKTDLNNMLNKEGGYWKSFKESLINDTNLLETTKRYVANTDNFKNIYYGMEKTISFETSLSNIANTRLGGLFVEQIQDYLVKETEYKKEIYKFKNEQIQEHLEVEGLIDDELKLKRKVKEISYFKERKELLTQAYNLSFIAKDDGNVTVKNDSSNSGRKVNKKISFEQENTKINFNIETLPVVPLDVKKKIKKKNMTIVKNNSDYLKTLKEIEISI